MDGGEVCFSIRDHCRIVNEPNCRRRVECKYCDKAMYHFYCLKYHLGGLPGGIVATCPKVPHNVKESVRSLLETERATSVNVHDHCVTLDEQKVRRFQCKYCGKAVSRLYRFKQHLGGIRGYVTSCPKVPQHVKESFRRSILETGRATLSKRWFKDHGITLDRPRCSRVQCNYCGKVMTALLRAKYHLGGIPGRNVTSCPKVPQNVKESFRSILATKKATHPMKRSRCLVSNGSKKRKSVKVSASDIECGNSIDTDSESEVSPKRIVSQTAAKADRDRDSSSRQDKKDIHGFFYETGVDSSVLKKMQEHVKIIRQSWKRTGCSILLDGWTDEKGRELVSFIVECPQGPVYLRSSDVSTIVDNVNALQLLLDGVIKDVGVQNVVQIVAFSSTGWVGALGKQFVDRYKSIFWTVDASHCLELILDKIAGMDEIKGTLDKAKVISKFVHGHPTFSKLLSAHTVSRYLIKPSKSAMPFLTLDNLISEKESVSAIFASSKWKTSIWASRMVADSSFWKEAEMVIKSTFPLVIVLHLINTDDKQQMGHIYEAMDQAKETIKDEFNGKKSQYMPFWEAIDEIWNGHLHSPLHAAGYFLNPSLFYSDDFHIDPEVVFGLLCCIVRLAPNTHNQDLISKQLDAYMHSKGAFSVGSSVEQRNKLSPASWWLVYGEEYPELQHFATRILSQTCVGASKYTLKRSLAEMVLTNERDRSRNAVEHPSLSDQAFVHYNLQLQQQHSNQSSSSLGDEEMADHNQPTCSSSSSFKQKNAKIQSNSNGTGSTITVKATYKEDTVRFKFDSSAGCYQLHEEVAKRFELQNGTFKIKYLDDEEEWVMLTTDSDLQECLEIVDSTRIVKFLVRDNMGSSADATLYSMNP